MAGVIALMLLGPARHACLAQEAPGNGWGSLLFAENELRAIDAALAVRPPEGMHQLDGGAAGSLQIPEDQPAWKIERLYLSALIYYEPRKWALWFGGRQVRPESIPPFLVNLRVTAQYVDLGVIPRPGASAIPVRLRPNQTFLINQLRIAEGGPTVN